MECIDLASDDSSDCEVVQTYDTFGTCSIKNEYHPSIRTIEKYRVKQELESKLSALTRPPPHVVEEAELYKAKSQSTKESGPNHLAHTQKYAGCSQQIVPKAKRSKHRFGSKMRGLQALFDAREEELGHHQTVATTERTLTNPKALPCKRSTAGEASVWSQLLQEAGVLAEVALDIQRTGVAKRTSRCQWRSIIFNVRRNKHLLRKINTREITFHDLVSLPVETLAPDDVKQKRQRLKEENLANVMVKDNSTFAVTCEHCGQDARGVMVHSSAGPLDNRPHGWSQMVMRGNCAHCSHTWVDGRE